MQNGGCKICGIAFQFAGYLVPSLLIGACFGRGVHVLSSLWDGAVHPGVYAMVGAAAVLATCTDRNADDTGFHPCRLIFGVVTAEKTGEWSVLGVWRSKRRVIHFQAAEKVGLGWVPGGSSRTSKGTTGSLGP